MWDCTDSQEVGLEAATLERVRNSSLVECACADNSPGLSPPPKPNWALRGPLVGERPAGGEAEAGAEVDRAGVRMPA